MSKSCVSCLPATCVFPFLRAAQLYLFEPIVTNCDVIEPALEEETKQLVALSKVRRCVFGSHEEAQAYFKGKVLHALNITCP